MLERLRHHVVVATKVGRPMGDGPSHRGLGRAHIRRACEASLRRLQTDRIDLYQAHAPDPHTPIEETLQALDELVRAGMVRAVGCSNFPLTLLLESLVASARSGLKRFGSVQAPCSVLHRAAEGTVAPICQAYGLGMIAYGSLAAGTLTDAGSRRAEASLDCAAAMARLRACAVARSLPLAAVALAWVLARPSIASVLVGASRPEQLRESIQGVGVVLDDALERSCAEVWQRVATQSSQPPGSDGGRNQFTARSKR